MKRAALLPQVQTDNGETIFSLVIKSQLHLPVFVHASRGFKGKVVVFTPWMLCIFLSEEMKHTAA